jgi:hypothetical protein
MTGENNMGGLLILVLVFLAACVYVCWGVLRDVVFPVLVFILLLLYRVVEVAFEKIQLWYWERTSYFNQMDKKGKK